MQAVGGGPVKIGQSIDVERRRDQLERKYKVSLAVLATLPGDKREEREIHARFAHLRFGKTEQFRPDSDLMEFIGHPLLVCANQSTVELMSSDGEFARIDSEVLRTARIVASFEELSLADYVSNALRPIVERDFARHVKKHAGKVDHPGDR